MTSKLEPAIWPRDTGPRILCFDRCQLIIARMSNIKEVNANQGCMSLSTYYLDHGRHVARLRRRRRAYAPTSNTASHDNHEKINSWVSFAFLYVFEYGAPLGGPSGRQSSAIISYHIISYHIISYHIISYHIISYHIISYHIISYLISHHYLEISFS